MTDDKDRTGRVRADPPYSETFAEHLEASKNRPVPEKVLEVDFSAAEQRVVDRMAELPDQNWNAFWGAVADEVSRSSENRPSKVGPGYQPRSMHKTRSFEALYGESGPVREELAGRPQVEVLRELLDKAGYVKVSVDGIVELWQHPLTTKAFAIACYWSQVALLLEHVAPAEHAERIAAGAVDPVFHPSTETFGEFEERTGER